MKEKIRIGILADKFIEWPGGIEFLKYVLLGFKNNSQYELTLLVPDRNTGSVKTKNIIKQTFNKFIKKKFTLLKYEPVEQTCDYLCDHLKIANFGVYKNHQELAKLVNKKIDIILPAFNNLGFKIKIPVIGYLYDFQFKYFPDFFKKEDITFRDNHFKKHIISDSDIIVNAHDVKKDIAKFYSRENDIHVIPFTPIFDQDLFFKIPDEMFLRDKYKISNKPYFIISNQFWQHKNHKLALEALHIATCELGLDCSLVCTGLFPDPKNESHCKLLVEYINQKSLNDRVIFPGFINKVDQLGLIINACAVLQPTQFEGGPGGFAVFEALAYHQRCLLSDIGVNKEIQNNIFVDYFIQNNARDLSQKMAKHLALPPTDKNPQILLLEFEQNRIKLESFWLELLHKTLKSHEI